jgi:hypothetical protein
VDVESFALSVLKSQQLCVSFQETGLVGGDHVFDVDEGIISTVLLKCLQSLLNEVSNVLSLLLAVVYPIPNVHCAQMEDTMFVVFRVTHYSICDSALVVRYDIMHSDDYYVGSLWQKNRHLMCIFTAIYSCDT